MTSENERRQKKRRRKEEHKVIRIKPHFGRKEK